VASDRTIGGFRHTWGEDSEHVKSKKRMLEAEGIVFAREGKVDKIPERYFMSSDSVTSNNCAEMKTNSKETPKRKRVERDQDSNQKDKAASHLPSAEVIQAQLKAEILALLHKRQKTKTC